MLMVWRYDEGFPYYKGEGHAGSINRVILKPITQ